MIVGEIVAGIATGVGAPVPMEEPPDGIRASEPKHAYQDRMRDTHAPCGPPRAGACHTEVMVPGFTASPRFDRWSFHKGASAAPPLILD